MKSTNIKGFKRLSFPIIIYFVGVALVGLCLMPLLPVKLTPAKALPWLTVSYVMQESPRAIESKVTSRIEAMLGRIDGVNSIESSSENGRGRVGLSIDKNADLDAVRFEVSTAIRQLWPLLPDGVSYPMVSAGYSSSDASHPFITYTLNAPAAPNRICEYAEKHIRPSLAHLKGISTIQVSGARPMEWVLEYDYLELNRLDVSVYQIQQAVSRYLGSDFLGLSDVQDPAGQNRYCAVYVKPESAARKEFRAARIPVKKIDGKIVYLNDLVKSARQEQKPQSYFRIDGMNAISLAVYADKQANQIQLSKQVRAELKKLEKNFPYGYEISLIQDDSEYVKKELKNVAVRSGLAVLILLVFVFALSRNWRYMGVITVALVSTIAIAFIFYYLLDIEIQLYSIAGITISLGLVIDNIIVMSDHLLHRNKMSVFIAILAATLTTMASLSVVFLLDENLRLNLQDFCLVLIVNLAVSLFVALFFIPALLEKSGLMVVRASKISTRRRIVRINSIYAALLRFLCRWRKTAFFLLVLAFGLPLFNLPPSLPGESGVAGVYNAVFPYANKLLGGSLRIFFDRPSHRGPQTERGETQLHIRAVLPNGATLNEMNETVKQMEYEVSRYEGVKQFQTHISSPLDATITVTFTGEAERTNLPYRMKEELISHAIHIGNATWSVTGVGDGFSNYMEEKAKPFCIELRGYNYDELIARANELRKVFLTYTRVKDLQILPQRRYNKLYEEYIFETHTDRLMLHGLHINDLYSAVSPLLTSHLTAGTILGDNGAPERIRLQSGQSHSYNVWDLNNYMQQASGQTFRLGQMAAITKQQAPQSINRINQQYRLYLEYRYLGNYQLGYDIFKNTLKQFSSRLPMGYTAKDTNEGYRPWWGYTKEYKKEYRALALIIFIIYIICCILSNSFRQPLAVIFIIPISYIGIFLTFGAFDLELNHGGFAAFVLLSGLTCNSAIYLLNDYNALRRKGRPKGILTYIRSLNGKIIPILMTFLSTALGFLPFMFAQENDTFWVSLAAGTISGLFFSLVGILIYLPLLVNGRKKK